MKKLTYLLAAILMIALLAPSAIAQENRDLWSKSTYVQSAKIIYLHEYKKDKRRETLQKAINLIDEAKDRFQRDPDLYFMLGTFYAEVNVLDTMVICFDSVETLCEDQSVDEKLRRNCYKKDKYIEKINDFRQKYWEESYNDAVEFLRQYDTIKVWTKLPVSEDSLATLDSLAEKAYSVAEADFEKAIMVKPTEPLSYDGLGILYQQHEEYFKAADQFKKAMARSKEDVHDQYVNKIAYAYIMKPDWDSAIVWFEKYLDYNPQDLNSLINLAVAHNNLEKYDKATEYYQQVLEVDPNNKQALFSLGQTYFVRMTDVASSDSTKFGNLAAQNEEVNKWRDKAEASFAKIIEVDPNDGMAINRLGILYLLSPDTADVRNAVTMFSRYLEQNPNSTDILDYLGRAYIRLGDFTNAIEPYKSLTELNPGNVTAWERLEELYRYTNQSAKAEEAKARADELKNL